MSGTAEKEKKAGKKPLPLIIGVVALLVILFMGKSVLGGSKHDGKDDKKKKESHEVGISVPLDEFMVNLTGGGDHYLRTTIALGMTKGVTKESADEHIAPMRDAILTVLNAKTLNDVVTQKGREGLKDEIKEKVNKALDDELVQKVYFTTFATQ